jgi:probable rRNA maturation factor
MTKADRRLRLSVKTNSQVCRGSGTGFTKSRMKIRFFNLPRKFPASFFQRVAKKVLKAEKKEDSALSIVFVQSAKMRKLNLEYRKKNRPTDVLSFSESANKENYLGEVLICIPEVGNNAKIYNQEFEQELKRVLIHGILHLLGYNHERKGGKMMKKQENYLSH